MRGSVGRFLVAAFAVLALVAVVTIAATSSTTLHSDPNRRPAEVLLDTTFSLALVGLLASAVFVVFIFAHRIPWEQPRRRGGLASLLVFAVAIILIAALDGRVRPPQLREPQDRPVFAPSTNASEDAASTAHEVHAAWLPMLVVLLLAAIGAAALYLSRRARRKPFAADRELVETLADVLAETLDDLRREKDPRRAVIAAYARLERALAAHGLPRRSAETQEEYVARILGQLDVGRSAVRRLTDLFTRAKFSSHDVDARMKDEAIAALERVRDELRASFARRVDEKTDALTAGREPA